MLRVKREYSHRAHTVPSIGTTSPADSLPGEDLVGSELLPFPLAGSQWLLLYPGGLGWSLLFPDGLWVDAVISWWILDGYSFFLMGHGWLPLFLNNSNTCTVRAPCPVLPPSHML